MNQPTISAVRHSIHTAPLPQQRNPNRLTRSLRYHIDQIAIKINLKHESNRTYEALLKASPVLMPTNTLLPSLKSSPGQHRLVGVMSGSTGSPSCPRILQPWSYLTHIEDGHCTITIIEDQSFFSMPGAHQYLLIQELYGRCPGFSF